MKQKILFGDDAKQGLMDGINLLADCVKVTFGPKGKSVIFNHIYGGVRSTKDGVSVAREVSPSDPVLNTGCKLIREAAQKTADEAGDGTTTSTILAQAMVKELWEKRDKEARTMKLGIELAVAKCKKYISENSHEITTPEQMRHIATISANNDAEVGDLIGDIFKQIGIHGEIALEDSIDGSMSMEVMGGYNFKRGFVSPYFINNHKKATCELSEPLILLYDKKIVRQQDIIQVMQYAVSQNRPLLIICSGAEGEALGMVVKNILSGKIQCCIVTAPDSGMRRKEIMDDIAVFTGGKYIDEEAGRVLSTDTFDKTYLGEALKVVISKDQCTIMSGQGDPLEIERRKELIKNAEAKTTYEKEHQRRRIASIGKGVAVLYVGAPTDAHRGDKKDLCEDAILATRAAAESGYVPGAALMYSMCSSILDANNEGELVVKNALMAPIRQLLSNSIGSDFHLGVTRNGFGYNVVSGEVEDLIQSGIIEPAKVVDCAITNAASVAITFLTTDCLITEIEDK